MNEHITIYFDNTDPSGYFAIFLYVSERIVRVVNNYATLDEFYMFDIDKIKYWGLHELQH